MTADLIQAIATVGFPIVAYLLMWHDRVRTMEKLTRALYELRDAILKK